MKKASIAVSHLLLAVSLVFLTLAIADRFNSAMAFINHNFTKKVLFAVLIPEVFFSAIMFVCTVRKKKPLRAVGYLFGALVCTALLTLLTVDFINPKLILFSKKTVKAVIFAVAVIGIFNSVIAIYGKRD